MMQHEMKRTTFEKELSLFSLHVHDPPLQPTILLNLEAPISFFFFFFFAARDTNAHSLFKSMAWMDDFWPLKTVDTKKKKGKDGLEYARPRTQKKKQYKKNGRNLIVIPLSTTLRQECGQACSRRGCACERALQG